MDSEKMAKQFQLLVPYSKQRGVKSEQQVVPVGSAWEVLTLAHSMEWPLPILFTPPILAK